jgi:hypothetical protein
MEDVKRKIKKILNKYNEFTAQNKISECRIRYLKHLLTLNNEELAEYYICTYTTSGEYDNSSKVEKEALRNFRLNFKADKTREDIRKEIAREESKINYKKSVLEAIDEAMSNNFIKNDEKFLIELIYINNYTWKDIAKKYNEKSRLALTETRLMQKRETIITKIYKIIGGYPEIQGYSELMVGG